MVRFVIWDAIALIMMLLKWKMRLKVSSAKRRPFCHCLNVLRSVQITETCYPSLGWFVRSLAWCRRPKARCTWQNQARSGFHVLVFYAGLNLIYSIHFPISKCSVGGVVTLRLMNGSVALHHWLLLWSDWGSNDKQSIPPTTLARRSWTEVRLGWLHCKICHGTFKNKR